MSVVGKLIEFVRRQVNERLQLDVVRVSGHYKLKAHVAQAIDDYELDAIIDVGANDGGFGTLMRSSGFKGQIFSFEPISEVFEALQRTAEKDTNWKVFNCALGSEAGEVVINVSRFSEFSSILNANDYGNSWENMKVERRQTAEVKTLDQCFEEGLIPNQKRYLLKLDTQGFDIEVFKGGLRALENVCCLLSEVSFIPAYEGAPHYLDALALFEAQGFKVSGFYPITRHKSLALNEADCMLVKPEELRAT